MDILSTQTMKELMQLAGDVPDGVSLEAVHDAVQYLEKFQPTTGESSLSFPANSILVFHIVLGCELHQ